METFEQKYNAALTWMRNIYPSLTGANKEDAEHYFPELKESEDEKMRKAALEGIEYLERKLGWDFIGDTDILDVKEYLEKRKEQKPIFKKGDKVIWQDEEFNILDVNGDSYNVGGYILPFSREGELRPVRQKPAEWSKEDEKIIDEICGNLDYLRHNTICAKQTKVNLENRIKWLIRLKSLRPQPKEEREHMEIKYGGKIYQVHGMRALPGGASGYIIEDEPGHYDCIMNPEEVLGGGYGVKQNGSPYPTKEATFDEPHWKPSEVQMAVLKNAIHFYGKTVGKEVLESLYNDLQNYFSL